MTLFMRNLRKENAMRPILDYADIFSGSAGYEPDGRAYHYHPPRGVRLIFNAAERSAPLITSEMPWEGNLAHATVRRDGGKYRMWYLSLCGKGIYDQFLCYAESEDGFEWTRPELGLFEFQGSARNNICRGGPRGARGSTFIDPSAPPAERYKRIGHCPQWYHEGKQISAEEGLRRWRELGEAGYSRDEVRQKVRLVGTHRAVVSPDGIHWTDLEDPLFEMFCDTHTICFYDGDRGKYVGYFRTHANGRKAIGRAETDDFRRWPKPETIVVPDLEDGPSHSLYTNAYSRYPGADIHVMFPAVFDQLNDKVDVYLAVSRDGINWLRAGRTPVLASRATGGAYMGTELLVLDDCRMAVPYWGERKIRHNEVYYLDRSKRSSIAWKGSRIAWATWPRDRIGGLRAEDCGCFSMIGSLAEGGALRINYATERGGWIRAALYKDLPYPPEKTEPLEGYGFEDCDALTGDEFEREVSWQGSADLSSFAGKKLTVRFEMMRATLYAWEFGRPGAARQST